MSELSSHYQRALVTGASSGLGQAFAHRLMAEGIEVWGTSRKQDAFEDAPGINPIQIDFDQEKHLSEWYRELDSQVGGFDILINNAGFSTSGKFGDFREEDIDNQLRVLLAAPMQLTLGAMRRMRPRKGGCIVNVSSMAGSFWLPFSSSYNAGKAGLSAFSQSLMLESPGVPPWIIDLRPGDFATSFTDSTVRRGEPSVRLQRIWRRMERNNAAGPPPQRAAEDLMNALKRFRHCTLFSGTLFQRMTAQMGERLFPIAGRRIALRRYFHFK